MFRPVDANINFIELEHRILDLWSREGAFAKRVELNRGKPRWSFLDGPITANNPMGVHHAWGRTYKDLFLRYRAMLGHELRYQNGFDCQGLWVEVEVEKELGFKSKQDIERFGVGEFIEKCKERVRTYAARQTEQSIRLGYWMDWDDSYFTMSDENNYCIWTFLKRCHENGWIYQGTDVMPWCPRCGSALSNMELDPESYKEVTHTSLYVRFPFVEDPTDGLLVWTTTPWTLAANVAAAVHPEREYVRIQLDGDRSGWAMADLAEAVAPGCAILERAVGAELVGRSYRTAMDDLPAQQGVAHLVIPWTEVTESEGTGIVHIAPGCGGDDFVLGKQHGLAVIAPIDESGRYIDGFAELTGQFAGDVTAQVAATFAAAGCLVRSHDYAHRYAHCWRCKSQILFRLVDEWFIAMDELRPRIMDVTRKIRWMPEYGMQHELDWLKNMGDWMISKKRYWGLALPIFRCECGWFDVVGSKEELQERASAGWDEFDGHSPHRPYVDQVRIRCGGCQGEAHRIADVGNPWLDAGIVPFSTLKWRTDPEYWRQWYPADFITESLPGQFRNWFYAMLCMSTVLENREPFRAVLGHALVRDEHGKPMHKSEGNAIWFDEAADSFGVDAMRWLYMRQNPQSNVNFGPGTVGDCRRRLMTLWNVYSFFVTYARIDGFDPAADRPQPADRSDLDRWILSRLQRLVAVAIERLGEFDPPPVVRAAEEFLDDLSNWYLRRSRRRFWKAEADADKRAAYGTLYEVLETLCRVLAPVVPFVTEEIYQNLVRGRLPGAPDSIHHCDYPQVDKDAIDAALEDGLAAVRTVTELGRAVRQEANIKVRQPLARMVVRAPSAAAAAGLERFADHLKDELNIHALELVDEAEGLVDYVVKPDFRKLGARLGKATGKVGAALKGEDGGRIQRLLAAGEPVVIEVDGESYSLTGEELAAEAKARAGLAVREADGYLVALDVTLTDELRREGLARDLVRHVQNLRKESGLEVQDRIRLTLDAPGELATTIVEWGDTIRRETLAVTLDSPCAALIHRAEVALGPDQVAIAIEKA